MMKFVSKTTVLLITLFTLLSCSEGDNPSPDNLNDKASLPFGNGGNMEVRALQNWIPGDPNGTTCPATRLEIEAFNGVGAISWTIYGATVKGFSGFNNEVVIVETPYDYAIVPLSFEATDAIGNTATLLGYSNPYECNYLGSDNYCKKYTIDPICICKKDPNCGDGSTGPMY